VIWPFVVSREATSIGSSLHPVARKDTLDGATPAATVTQWITEAAEQERAAASDLHAATAAAPPRLTVDDVLATIEEMGSLAGVLSTSEPNDRAQLYEALGVAATHDANARTAVLELALPRSANNVSEGGLAG